MAMLHASIVGVIAIVITHVEEAWSMCVRSSRCPTSRLHLHVGTSEWMAAWTQPNCRGLAILLADAERRG